MSETSALSLSQADGAAETPAPAITPVVKTPTTLELLNLAVFEYGAAHLNEQTAGEALSATRAAAYDVARTAEDKMKALYKQYQAELSAQGGAK